MRITIEYDSSWRNSFLDGSNNEKIPKKGRNFIGSIKALKDKSKNNYIERHVTKDTVMGILNRLIGEQRKLYQVRQDENYYLRDIENILTDIDISDSSKVCNETVYLRNISGNTDPALFSGMIQANHPVFNSDYSKKFWGILWLELDKLIQFILDELFDVDEINDVLLDPIIILNRSSELKKLKGVSKNDLLLLVVNKLNDIFPNESYIEKNETIKPMRLYSAALYIQLERLRLSFDVTTAYNRIGNNIYVYGYSKRDFNGPRDFMKNFTTGGEKIVWGNPYIKPDFINGEGKFNRVLTKTSGLLEMILNISEERAKDLELKILDAGVSSFYLGKKGLAYVTKIDTREN